MFISLDIALLMLWKCEIVFWQLISVSFSVTCYYMSKTHTKCITCSIISLFTIQLSQKFLHVTKGFSVVFSLEMKSESFWGTQTLQLAAVRPVGCSRLSVLYIIKHHCKNRTNFWLNLLWHSLLAHLLTRYLIDWFSSLSSMLTSSLTWWERVSTRNQLSVYRTACSSCER